MTKMGFFSLFCKEHSNFAQLFQMKNKEALGKTALTTRTDDSVYQYASEGAYLRWAKALGESH